jgi:hypothetical protein
MVPKSGARNKNKSPETGNDFQMIATVMTIAGTILGPTRAASCAISASIEEADIKSLQSPEMTDRHLFDIAAPPVHIKLEGFVRTPAFPGVLARSATVPLSAPLVELWPRKSHPLGAKAGSVGHNSRWHQAPATKKAQ